MTLKTLMVFSWIFNEFDLKMKISWAINGEFLREFHGNFTGFLMLFSWDFHRKNPMNYTMKNLLKLHENLVIFPLKFSQDFNGFWFQSVSI